MNRRIIIVDDEFDARRVIVKYLERYFPTFSVVGEAESMQEAIRLLNEIDCDILFLDISLGDGTGFELLDKVDLFGARVIFTTAYDNYALKAFRYEVQDYLLKPIDPELFEEAVNKASEYRRENNAMSHDDVLTNFGFGERKMSIPTNEGMVFIQLREIICIEADSSYCTIYTVDGQKRIVSKPLKYFSDKLQHHIGFLRPHKSFVVNMSFACEYWKEDGGCIRLSNNMRIPIARQKKEEILRDFQRRYI